MNRDQRRARQHQQIQIWDNADGVQVLDMQRVAGKRSIQDRLREKRCC